MKELLRTRFTSTGEVRPSDERYECLELAYRYVMKGYEITISEQAILCRVRLQDRYTDIINFINGKIKKD